MIYNIYHSVKGENKIGIKEPGIDLIDARQNRVYRPLQKGRDDENLLRTIAEVL